MAQNLLLKYIQDKLKEDRKPESQGPVVTISREYGCPGTKVGEEIAKALSQKQLKDGQVYEWKLIDKEIIQLAAEQIQLPESLIEKIAQKKPPGIIESLFGAFSDVYMPNDIKVKKTIANIIISLATQGKVVILGRAGVILTRKVPDALHIRLYAPMEWRIEKVMKMRNVDKDTAQKIIDAIDRERVYLRSFFAGENTDSNIFDVQYNCSTITEEDICKSFLSLMEARNIIKK